MDIIPIHKVRILNKNNSGFTILELIVGMGLTVILLVCVASAANSFFKAFNTVRDSASISPKLTSTLLWLYDENYNYDPEAVQPTWNAETSGSTKLVRLASAPSGEGVLINDLQDATISTKTDTLWFCDILRLHIVYGEPINLTVEYGVQRCKNE